MSTKNKKSATAKPLEFPSFIVPANEDEFDIWIQQMTDAIIISGQHCLSERDNRLFKYAQARVDESEFDHITKLYINPNNKRFNKVLPAKIRQVNALAHLLNRAVGKVDAYDLKYSCVVVNEDAVTQKLEDLSADVAEKLTRAARQTGNVSAILGRPLDEQDELPIPTSVEDVTLSTWQQTNEELVTKGLKYLIKKKSNFLKYKFNHQGLYNYFVTGKMAFDTFIDLDDPQAESIDPRFLIYDLNSTSPFIQHGRFAGYYFNCSPQELLDRCPEMDDAQVKYLNETQDSFKKGNIKYGVDYPEYYVDSDINALFFNCYRIYFKASKRVRVKISPNRFDADNPHIHFVDDKEKASEDKGDKIEYRYINTLYEVTKFGNKYYQPREIPGQFVPNDAPAERELPLCGIIADIPSIVELAEPLQNMRIQCFYALERLIGQAKGKILVVDEAIEEDGPDNLYNMMAFQVYKINTAKEGEMQQFNGSSGYMQPKEIDMGLSSAVNDLMRMVAFIDQNLYMITGMNDTFQGVVKSDQGLGVTQTAIEQAQMTLQPYYSDYYSVIEMTLQSLCNLMRPAWGGKDKTAYFLGDKGYEFFSLKADMAWHLDQYGVFVENNVGSNQRREYMINMASQLLPIAKDPELALSVIKMFNSSSAAEAERIFEQGINAMKRLRDEENKFAQTQQQAAMQQAGAIAQDKSALEREKIE